MSIDQREARSIIRKAVKRVPEGEEIRHLNIMPMMDIMTVLLIAFIFQASVGAEALSAGQVDLPTSRSQEMMPESAALVIITADAIVVEEQEVVAVRNGDIDASHKEGGAFGLKIPRLTQYLGALRASDEEEALKAGRELPDKPELMIIADQLTPYRLLVSVLYSANQPEAGYKRFRLVVMKYEPVLGP
jgi:biopolymer transport protein ExbD